MFINIGIYDSKTLPGLIIEGVIFGIMLFRGGGQKEKRIRDLLEIFPEGFISLERKNRAKEGFLIKSFNEKSLKILEIAKSDLTPAFLSRSLADFHLKQEKTEMASSLCSFNEIFKYLLMNSGEELILLRLRKHLGAINSFSHDVKLLIKHGSSPDILNLFLRKIDSIEDLKSQNQMKTRLINSFSHELKTPLNSSIPLLELALSSFTTDNTYLQKALVSLRLLENALNNILDYSLLLSDELIMNYSDVRIEEVVQDIQTILNDKIDLKNLKFTMNIPQNLVIYTDYTRLKQILLNLLLNSIQFTEQGKSLSLSVFEISSKPMVLRFEVEDSGIGIPNSQLQILRENLRFNRGNPIPINSTGSCLGLIVSNELAFLLGNEPIVIESEWNMGTKVSFKLTDMNVEPAIREILGEEHMKLIERSSPSTTRGKRSSLIKPTNAKRKNNRKKSFGIHSRIILEASRRFESSRILASESKQKLTDEVKSSHETKQVQDLVKSIQDTKQRDEVQTATLAKKTAPTLYRQYPSSMMILNNDRSLKSFAVLPESHEPSISLNRIKCYDFESLITRNTFETPLYIPLGKFNKRLPTVESLQTTPINNFSKMEHSFDLTQSKINKKLPSTESLKILPQNHSKNTLESPLYYSGQSKINKKLPSAESFKTTPLNNNPQAKVDTYGYISERKDSSLSLGCESVGAMNKSHFGYIRNQILNNRGMECSCPEVLLVDDDVFNLFSLELLMKSVGLRCAKTGNGFEAVRYVKEQRDCGGSCKGMQLILMDYQMPGMDGVEATREIVKIIQGKKEVKIVGCTAFCAKTEVFRMMDAGMKDVIFKPVSLAGLRELVRKHLGWEKK